MAEKNTEEKKPLADKVSGFLAKYRVLFIGVIVALIIVAIVWGVISSVTTSSHQKGLNQLDSIIYTLSKADEASVDTARDVALPQVLELAEKNKGNIVGLRSSMAAAEIYFSQEKWGEARDCWLAAATTMLLYVPRSLLRLTLLSITIRRQFQLLTASLSLTFFLAWVACWKERVIILQLQRIIQT